MKKWVCPVCGYVHEGDTPPAECPVCHVPGSKFIEQSGDMKLAAEHEYGIYAKTVKDNADISAEDKAYILEQLKANFTGECSEVGMYLCMARIAHREGYPEIGLYWEKAGLRVRRHPGQGGPGRLRQEERSGRHPRHRPRDGPRRGPPRPRPEGPAGALLQVSPILDL